MNKSVYVATGFGGLIASISDVIRFQYTGAVGKIGDGLNLIYQFSADLRYLAVIGFIILIALGTAWLREPCSKACGFLIGLGVLTLFSLIAGNPENTSITKANHSTSISIFFSTAYAQEPEENINSTADQMSIQFEDEQGNAMNPNIVILRDTNTGKVVRWQNQADALIKVPKGNFRFEVAAKGFRRSTGTIDSSVCSSKCSFKIESSKIPTGIQMLYTPAAAISK